MKIINFFKSCFNWNCGYSVKERTFPFFGKLCTGYVLYKHYICFWIPGYDRVEVFIDKQSLEQYLEFNSIKLN